MATLRKRGGFWHYRYVDENGKQRERKGCPDRRETERLAAAAEAQVARIKGGLIDPKDVRFRDQERRPIKEHLDDFKASLLAKGNTSKHASVTRNRADRVLALAKVKRLSEIALSTTQEALGEIRAKGSNQETINHHVRAVKAFSRWLWKDKRVREHPLAHLSTASSEADRRRVRRALTVDEARRLIQATENGGVVKGLSGPDRAMIYRIALATGFRASEIASFKGHSFHLDGSEPTITVRAAYTKNGKLATQPIPKELAALLRGWQPPKLTDRTAEMLRHDLDAAGIPDETHEGVMDFHALRTSFISHVVSSGASVKTAQTLARHSTPSLTIGLYARTTSAETAKAVEDVAKLACSSNRLPFISPSPGTETGGNRAVTGGMNTIHRSEHGALKPEPKVLMQTDFGALCRMLSQCRRRDSNSDGGYPPEDFKSSASAVRAILHRRWIGIGSIVKLFMTYRFAANRMSHSHCTQGGHARPARAAGMQKCQAAFGKLSRANSPASGRIASS